MDPVIWKKRLVAWRKFEDWESSLSGRTTLDAVKWYGETLSWLMKSGLLDPKRGVDPEKLKRVCQFHKAFAKLLSGVEPS